VGGGQGGEREVGGDQTERRGEGGGAEAIGVMFSQGNRNTATTALQLGTHTHKVLYSGSVV
jgi:hypothetical protein